jgi:hypothetical protein
MDLLTGREYFERRFFVGSFSWNSRSAVASYVGGNAKKNNE